VADNGFLNDTSPTSQRLGLCGVRARAVSGAEAVDARPRPSKTGRKGLPRRCASQDDVRHLKKPSALVACRGLGRTGDHAGSIHIGGAWSVRLLSDTPPVQAGAIADDLCRLGRRVLQATPAACPVLHSRATCSSVVGWRRRAASQRRHSKRRCASTVLAARIESAWRCTSWQGNRDFLSGPAAHAVPGQASAAWPIRSALVFGWAAHGCCATADALCSLRTPLTWQFAEPVRRAAALAELTF